MTHKKQRYQQSRAKTFEIGSYENLGGNTNGNLTGHASATVPMRVNRIKQPGSTLSNMEAIGNDLTKPCSLLAGTSGHVASNLVARPWGWHNGMAGMLLCDGHVENAKVGMTATESNNFYTKMADWNGKNLLSAK